MTTIAWDGKTLAADTRSTGVFIMKTVKIAKINNDLFAYAGAIQDGALVMKWYADGCPPPEKPTIESNFSAIVIRGKRCFWMENNLALSFYEYPRTKQEIEYLETKLIDELVPILNISSKVCKQPF